MSNFVNDQNIFVNKISMLIRARTGGRFIKSIVLRNAIDQLYGIYGEQRQIYDSKVLLKVLANGIKKRQVRISDLIKTGIEIEGDLPKDLMVIKCYLSDLMANQSRQALKNEILKAIDPDKKQPALMLLAVPALYEYLDR